MAWERFLWRWECWFIHLHKSWREAPAWNFVAIAGTAGILLTILLFLAPIALTTPLAARDRRSIDDRHRPAPWELDSRYDADRIAEQKAYPIELEFAASDIVDEPAPRRRRRPAPSDFDSLSNAAPLDDSWRTPDPPQSTDPPRFDWDIEIVCHHRQPPRNFDAPDVTLTARADPFISPAFDDDFWNGDIVLDWKICRRPRHPGRDPLVDPSDRDHQTVAAAIEEEPAPISLEAVIIPEAASEFAEIALDIEWLPPRDRRHHRQPQFLVRNSGSQHIERIDVILVSLTEQDLLEINAPALQSWRKLSPGSEESLRVVSRRTPIEILSVVTTGFVGSITEVAPPETPPEQPPREQIPIPEPPHPHLKLTTGTPQRLRQFHMLSLPIQVVNDGNIALDEVLIVADVPKSLSHRYGQTVHYRVGHLRPGQVHQTVLLLTALEPGAVELPLTATDELRSALDEQTANLEVLVEDVARKPKTDVSATASDEKSSTEDF